MANTNFRESGVDIINKYISQTSPALEFIDDVYLTDAGKILKYGYLPQSLWSWGYNNYGQLGLGDRIHRSSPVQVGALNNWSKISGGQNHTVSVKGDGTLWAWGWNGSGQLGLGDVTNRSSPVQVGSLTNWSQVAGGGEFSLALKTDGTLWAWGRGGNGRLGLGNTTSISSPVQVGLLTDWAKISISNSSNGGFALAIKTDGTLWAWGDNGQGRLGLGDTTDRSSPVQVGVLTNWSQIVARGGDTTGFSLALKTDGTLWSWGDNASGKLGLGDTTDMSSPVQVGLLTDWSQISGAEEHSLALKTDGTLWAWGRNGYGQLGLDDTNDRSSPVQVGILTDWSKISGGGEISLAVKNDGTLWAWGRNNRGQLGLGNTTNISSPVQVGILTGWYQISGGQEHSLALVG